MNHKNSLCRVVCFLLVLCGFISFKEAGRMQVQAADSEKKLYLEYLAKEEKRNKTNVFEEYQITGYKILDLNKDGKKELLYGYWSGGARSSGAICGIRKGKVKKLVDFGGSPQFYTVKGSKNQVVVGGANSAYEYVYSVFVVSANGLKEKDVYVRVYDDSDHMRVTKNEKEISRASFQAWEDKLAEIKPDDYKPVKPVEKSQHVRSEKEIYLKYLTRMKKSLLKKYSKSNIVVPLSDYYLEYKIMDLNGDGTKELLYTFQVNGFPGSDDPSYLQQKGRICTIQNGKVKQMWESDTSHAITFHTIKGSESEIVVDKYITGGIHHIEVYHVASAKLEKNDSYIFRPIVGPESVENGYFRKDGEERVKDPFGKDDENLKYIELKRL